MFVPVVNLHFFLVFPRPNPVLVRHKRRVLLALYGITTAYLIALWGSMFAARWFSLPGADAAGDGGVSQSCDSWQRGTSRWRVFLYAICIYCVVYSYRNAQTRGERNQVRWIMWASLIASVLIAYLLIQAVHRPCHAGPWKRRLADVRRLAACTRSPTPSASRATS